MSADPVLSVIIAAYNARDTIRQCLRSLADQTVRSSLEVIVVDSSSDGTGSIIAGEFPWVRHFVFSQRKYCGDARNMGLTEARGRIIALTDADCMPRKNWAEEILRAHEKHAELGIGGAIANGNPENLVGWGAYFCEFTAWMPGNTAGLQTDIAAANMSYKREVFNRYGTFIPGTYCSDTEFHWRIRHAGLSLRFDPEIMVCHRNITSLGRFLKHEFQHGRSFARMRVAAQHFSPARRVLYSACFGLIAAKLLLQTAARNIKNAVYLRHFCISFPLTVLGLMTWSFGEAFGYILSQPSSR
jgi:glycosyltransferase involved in cell wall biosynthesis